jgi:hypothetical protein
MWESCIQIVASCLRSDTYEDVRF